MNHYKHWNVQVDSQGILWLGLDRQHESVNTINHEVLDELNGVLQDVEEQTSLKGLVIFSAKAKGFIAGADVHLFSKFKNTEIVVEFLRKGQLVFARLQSLSIPTVAMIDGFCMGGGFELALACNYRIASDSAQTRIGLPEIFLGFPPGWGGTVRLPRLIGGFSALKNFILPGKSYPAAAAKKLGVVDEVVPVRQLKRAAIAYIEKMPAKHRPSFFQKLGNQGLMRSLLAFLIRQQMDVNPDHYPAPDAVIDLWAREGASGERAYTQETQTVQQLIGQPGTATQLIRTFLLRDKLKSFAKQSSFKAQKVHVIGAGTMGGDIAAWCAYCGLTVTVQDRGIENLSAMMARAYSLFQKILKKPRLIQAAMDRLIPDVEGDGLAHADVIIEAVFENLNVKRALFKIIEERAKPEALLATNTSSIPLEQIAEILDKPSRLVGIHFFNPVSKMDLVEVVSGEQTEEAVQKAALAFVGQIKKLPLPVRSSPGFLINRVLMPYLMAAVQLIQEGVQPELVDQSALQFGMRMGPVELADTVGLDVCLAVAENLTAAYGGQVPNKLREMVKNGQLGRKSGQGFYRYRRAIRVQAHPILHQLANIWDKILLIPVWIVSSALRGVMIKTEFGKKMYAYMDQYGFKSDKKTEDLPQHWIDALIQPMLHEAQRCLDEGVVESADLLDAGMIFATGFAPFRGGPMHYLQETKTMKHTRSRSSKDVEPTVL